MAGALALAILFFVARWNKVEPAVRHRGSWTMIKGLVPVARETVAVMLEAGQLLNQMGQKKQAADVIAGLEHLLPNSGVPPMFRGNQFFAEGQLAKAEEAHRTAVERESDRGACWAHLGEVLLWAGKVEEGVAACNRAMTADDHDNSAKQFAKNLLAAQELGCFDLVDG
jgi:predicted Zn-dependent protease